MRRYQKAAWVNTLLTPNDDAFFFFLNNFSSGLKKVCYFEANLKIKRIKYHYRDRF